MAIKNIQKIGGVVPKHFYPLQTPKNSIFQKVTFRTTGLLSQRIYDNPYIQNNKNTEKQQKVRNTDDKTKKIKCYYYKPILCYINATIGTRLVTFRIYFFLSPFSLSGVDLTYYLHSVVTNAKTKKKKGVESTSFNLKVEPTQSFFQIVSGVYLKKTDTFSLANFPILKLERGFN